MINLLRSLWYHKETRSVIMQILGLAFVFFVIFYLASNVIGNYASLNKNFSYNFLSQSAGYDINYKQALIEFTSLDTHGRAAIVGLLNTLLIAITGIIAATIIGFTVGIARLSHNWIINRLAYLYVEILRNIPILLQILFWAGIFRVAMPHPKQAHEVGSFYLHNGGLNMPRPILESGQIYILIAFLLGLGYAIYYAKKAKKKQELTGQRSPVILTSFLAIIGLPVIMLGILGFPLHFEYPELGRFKLDGGIELTDQFISLWFALSTYTASFIAEIVRSGILSVSHGQTEAALSLGLKRSWATRLILIPQAMRVVIPPMSSQYLNLTKNSSLAIAVGYYDIVATLGGSTLNVTGREMESMILVLGLYLIISLLISVLMNIYNRKIALQER